MSSTCLLYSNISSTFSDRAMSSKISNKSCSILFHLVELDYSCGFESKFKLTQLFEDIIFFLDSRFKTKITNYYIWTAESSIKNLEYLLQDKLLCNVITETFKVFEKVNEKVVFPLKVKWLLFEVILRLHFIRQFLIRKSFFSHKFSHSIKKNPRIC